jgi:leucyl aminopeptidase
VAVATLAALSELKAPFAVDCWLAITENRMSAKAYKPRDIVIASNGVSIEVIHTDAEGRMALADTLALAGKHKPAVMVDFATLTGSCVAAVSERYSGALTNRPELNQLIIEAGRACGERVWPFPMDQDFDEDLHTEMADVLQCAPSGGGDHIQAARFLNHFVPANSAWVHVDLSSASRKGGLAQVPTEITGFGARFALSLVLDNYKQLVSAAKG